MARSKGRGSITRMEDKPKARCRSWRLRVKVDGKERSRRFHGTYSQAETALEDFKRELESPQTDATFSDFAWAWEDSRQAQSQTLAKERTIIRRLEPVFGGMRLDAITPQIAEAGLSHIQSSKRLSGTTMNATHSLFKRIMGEAVKRNLIADNPLDSVPAPKRDTKEKQALTFDEVRRFVLRLDSFPLDAHVVAIEIGLLAGLRRAEIVGLEWRDVADGMIKVRRTVTELDGTVKGPKSAAGIRNVPVLPALQSTLDEWKGLQSEQLSALGLAQLPDTPVVTSSTGTRMRAQNLYRWWKQHREELGVDCTLHELRHTFLTMLANSGCSPQSLKSIAGWSSIKMADTYCHTDDAANRAAVERLGDAFEGGTW